MHEQEERRPKRLEDVEPKGFGLGEGVEAEEAAKGTETQQPVAQQADSDDAAVNAGGGEGLVSGGGEGEGGGEPPGTDGAGDLAPSPRGRAAVTIDGELLNPATVRSVTARTLDKVALLLIRRCAAALEATEKEPLTIEQLSELIRLFQLCRDLQLTDHWTRRLEDAIVRNPALLQQSHVPGQLRKVAGLAAKTKKAAHVDRRTTAGKWRELGSDLPD